MKVIVDKDHERYIVMNIKSAEMVHQILTNECAINDDVEIEEGLVIADFDVTFKRLMQEIEAYNKYLPPMTIELRGNIETRRVWLFDKELYPAESLKHRNHSPDGFNWGYSGSGPAQLSLAICLKLFNVYRALEIYQDIKFRHIAAIRGGQNFNLLMTLDETIYNKNRIK